MRRRAVRGRGPATTSVRRAAGRRLRLGVAAAGVVAGFTALAGACTSTSPTAGQPSPDASPISEASPTPDPPARTPPPISPTPQPSATATPTPTPTPLAEPVFAEFTVPAGDRPHDVAPAPDGRVWYTAQRAEALGALDPDTGDVERIHLGAGSAPHGVIVGPDGAPWVTDGGLNAIVRVDPDTFEVEAFPLPRPPNANLNTAAFDGDGVLWFTGQAGVYGRLDPDGDMEVFDAPRGTGPYGIAATPDGTVWYSSLAGSYIARLEPADASAEVVDVPTSSGGARRVWSDSSGQLWATEWFAGNLARYDPATGTWEVWRLPGDDPQPYAVYVDEDDTVWVTDFGADALVAFDSATEEFRTFAFPTAGANVRQLLGRPGEIWGAGSGTDTLVVLRTR